MGSCVLGLSRGTCQPRAVPPVQPHLLLSAVLNSSTVSLSPDMSSPRRRFFIRCSRRSHSKSFNTGGFGLS